MITNETTLNDEEIKMSNALVDAVDKAVDEVFRAHGQDPEEKWSKELTDLVRRLIELREESNLSK